MKPLSRPHRLGQSRRSRADRRAVGGAATARPVIEAAVIDRWVESNRQMTEALIVSQDQVAALRALVEVPVGSLDDDRSLELILLEGLDLTGSDCGIIVLDRGVVMVGDVAAATALRDLLGVGGVKDARGARPQPFLSGSAVIGTCGPEQQTLFGMARTGPSSYSTGDVHLIDAVLATVDKMLRLLTLHRSSVARAGIEREHQLASTLAQAVMPDTVPDVPGVELFASCRPAHLAGGDILVVDVVDGALWFAVGDVAGKGLPAAIVMTRAVSAARMAFRGASSLDPSSALAAIGADLHDYLVSVSLFVTMVVGVHVPGSGEVFLCNSGHSPVLSLTHDGVGSVVDVVPATRPPLGVWPGAGPTRRVPLVARDCLIIGSDGLVEQENPDGVALGYDRFRASVIEHSHLAPSALGQFLLAQVTQHAAGAAPSDDRTLLVVRADHTVVSQHYGAL